MKRRQVQSSNIKSIGYNPYQHKMEIEFNSGAVYRYKNVPKSEYLNLLSAESKGRYFHKNMRSVYKYRKHIDKNGNRVRDSWHYLPQKVSCDMQMFMEKVAFLRNY